MKPTNSPRVFVTGADKRRFHPYILLHFDVYLPKKRHVSLFHAWLALSQTRYGE